ncbi:hypothetical protein L204_106077 [Cryptococcus depauperatus]|nr:hypothetical protein L204_05206 [Cryptococcus depauperatus CBS 7855]
MFFSLRPLALSARPILRRGYAASAGGNPHLTHPTDSRSQQLREMLYPSDSYSPTSSTPTGTYHPDYLERLQTVVPSAEAYETIERAWQLYQRERREARKVALNAKYQSMVRACDELEQITNPANGGPENAEGKGALYHRLVYDESVAQARQAQKKGEQPKGRKTSEQKWLDSRAQGLVPRESWIPVENRGKGWDYDWQRPSK